MAKKSGLGRGLEALFPETMDILNNENEEKIKDGEKIEIIKISKIEPNKNQPRRMFDEESLEELASSIKKYGVIQPIIVSEKDGYYQIIAGERRWRASKKAGLTEMPVIIRENDDRRNQEIALIENIQREDLNALDKAKGIELLMKEHELNLQDVSEIIGKSMSAVSNSLRILNLDKRVQQLLLENKLTEGHCKSLVGVTDNEKQYQMALRIIKTGASVRDVERQVKEVKKGKNKTDLRSIAIYQDIENKLQSRLGTKVSLTPGKKSGKIVIQYHSAEELDRVMDLIMNKSEI